MHFIIPPAFAPAISNDQPSFQLPPFLRNAQLTRISGSFGEICTQSVSGKDFAAFRHTFRHNMPLRINATTDKPIITLTYMLKGNVPSQLKGFGHTWLHEDCHYLYYVPEGSHPVELPSGEADVLQFNLHPGMLEELSSRHQPIREVYHNARHSSDAGLQQYSARITPTIRRTLDDICHCTLPADQQPTFLRARLNDLLLEYVSVWSGHHMDFRSRYHFTEADLEALHEALRLIAGDIARHYTRDEIARAVCIHPRKLSEGFRHAFGITLKDYLAQLRINKARQLLLETNASVRVIAGEVGYENVSAFIRAFHAQTGRSPASFRNG